MTSGKAKLWLFQLKEVSLIRSSYFGLQGPCEPVKQTQDSETNDVDY